MLPCKLCDKVFNSKASLLNHLRLLKKPCNKNDSPDTFQSKRKDMIYQIENSSYLRTIAVTEFIDGFARFDGRFKNLIGRPDIKEVVISDDLNAIPDFITKNDKHSLYGQFMDYLIRHMVANIAGLDISDFRSTTLLSFVTQVFPNFKKIGSLIKGLILSDTANLDSELDILQALDGKGSSITLKSKYNAILQYMINNCGLGDQPDVKILKTLCIYVAYSHLLIKQGFNGWYYYKDINQIVDALSAISHNKEYNDNVLKALGKLRDHISTQYYLIKIFDESFWNSGQESKTANNLTFKQLGSLVQSYYKYITEKDSSKILNDIFNVSIFHSLFYNNTRSEDLAFIDTNIQKENIGYDSIYKYLLRKIKGIDKSEIILNPSVGKTSHAFRGDGDIIIGKEFIDIKTSTSGIGKSVSHFYQLYMYSALYWTDNYYKFGRLTIFNPLNMTEYCIDISEWGAENQLLRIANDIYKEKFY